VLQLSQLQNVLIGGAPGALLIRAGATAKGSPVMLYIEDVIHCKLLHNVIVVCQERIYHSPLVDVTLRARVPVKRHTNENLKLERINATERDVPSWRSDCQSECC